MKTIHMINKKKGVKILVPDHRVPLMKEKGYVEVVTGKSISAKVKSEVKHEK